MAGTNEPEVKDVDRVEVTPAGDDAENVDDTEDTDPESSQGDEGDEGDGDASDEGDGDDTKKPDQLVDRQKKPDTQDAGAQAQGDDDAGNADGIKRLPGETDREYALRLENKRLRTKLRGEQGAELLGGERPAPGQKRAELSDEEKQVLGKYKPEEIGALKEVIPVLAKEMGFVRKDELESGTYAERSQEILDGFLDKHPEYLPENDKDGTLWNAFKEEYKLYKPPANPKDFSKIFERVHRSIFGIKPAGAAKTTINAQGEKTKVASHTGASSTATGTGKAKPASAKATGLRTDMLKGFSDDELSELTGDEE